MSMNQFDFTYVQVFAKTKTALKAAGVKVADIQSRLDGFKQYGKQRFPQYVYLATVGYFPASGDGADEVANSWRAKGVVASVKYHAAD